MQHYITYSAVAVDQGCNLCYVLTYNLHEENAQQLSGSVDEVAALSATPWPTFLHREYKNVDHRHA